MRKLLHLCPPIIVLNLCFVLFGCSSGSQENIVSSPNGKLKLKTFQKDGRSYYTVHYQDSLIVEESPLGIDRKDEQFYTNLIPQQVQGPKRITDTYTLASGKQLRVSTEANELKQNFKNANGAEVQFIFRVYNDGVAFRYHFPGEKNGVFEILNEHTGFKLPVNGKSWLQPYDSISTYSPGYERHYTNGSPIGERSPEKEGWCFGGLFEVSNTWMLLTEASLDGSYSASRLQQQAQNGLYSIGFPDNKEAMGTGNALPQSRTLPWSTPWRVIIVSRYLADIVQSNLVTSLSEPSQVKDATWVKPGLVSWSWWADPDSPKNYKSMLPFIDFASRWSIPYFLADANWDSMKNGTVEQLIDYASKKNVGIWLWYNSGGPHNTVTEAPRNLLWDAKTRKQEFSKLQAWGVKGIKVDFFQSDKQHIIQQYIDILRDAADYKILINFHGCTLPRGWQRTWPNLVGMEAIAGEENYMFRESYPKVAPWHNTIQPFTRNVVGPMDYTPLGLSNKKYPHLTSSGHELALLVVFESGVVHLVDFPNVYDKLPEYVQNFIKTVPTVWDETRLVGGYPGKDVTVARRSGTRWFVGGINGEMKPKKFLQPLPFLDKNKQYKVGLITDAGDSKAFGYREMTLRGGDSLSVDMMPAGGFTAVIE
jgi:hypothetical protein